MRSSSSFLHAREAAKRTVSIRRRRVVEAGVCGVGTLDHPSCVFINGDDGGRWPSLQRSKSCMPWHSLPYPSPPCAVHVLATEPGDEGGMMAKRVVVDDACLQEGDTLDCVVGHRRGQRETNPGRLEAETAKVPC